MNRSKCRLQITLTILLFFGLVGCSSVKGSKTEEVTKMTTGSRELDGSANTADANRIDLEPKVPLVIPIPNTKPTAKPVTFLTLSMQPEDIVKQDFRQVLQVTRLEFSEADIVDYEFLMASYTEKLGFDVAAASPEITSKCTITAQELLSLFGRNNTQTNLLTVSFTMEYNGGMNGFKVDNDFPNAFKNYINSNLESVTADMQARSIPVNQARMVEAVGALSAPTDSPSERPTLSPSSKPTRKPTPLPSTSPSLSPTTKPTPMPTEVPTSEPTEEPTSVPTSSPTLSPSANPTKVPTTDAPFSTLSLTDESSNKRMYKVQSKMVLYTGEAMLNDDGELQEEPKETWIQVTQDWIYDATTDIIGENNYGIDEDDFSVSVSLNSHEVLGGETRRMMLLKRSNSLRRKLLSETPLQLDFTTAIEFHSDTSFNGEDSEWDASEMVGSSFRTPDQQEAYIIALQEADDIFNNGLENMSLEVDGVLVTEAPSIKTAAMAGNTENTGNTNGSDGKSKNTLVYAIAVAFGAVMILVLIGLYYGRKRRRETRSKSTGQRLSASDELNQEQYSTDNDGSHTSNSQEEEEGDEGDELHHQSDSNPAIFNSITAVAPPGKLGIVIANPEKDVPVVLQMKEDSVLDGQVHVGDLLLSVDEVDCNGMSASEVSDLIGSRVEAEARMLVLLREQ